MDHVEQVIQQWHKERADLNVDAMAITGRVLRLSLLYSKAMEKTFSEFGLHTASFDVLATLLRSGPPYSLSPSDLIASSMVTSGTMTNRLDQLEKTQLITRIPSEKDKRSMLITLTETGLKLINQAIESHVKTLDELTNMLSEQEHDSLSQLLAKMLGHFENS